MLVGATPHVVADSTAASAGPSASRPWPRWSPSRVSNTLWETVLQQRIPQASLSRVSSYDWMVSLAFQPVAFVIIGPLAGAIGEVQTLLLASAIALAANFGAFLVPSIRNMRRLDEDAALSQPQRCRSQ